MTRRTAVHLAVCALVTLACGGVRMSHADPGAERPAAATSGESAELSTTIPAERGGSGRCILPLRSQNPPPAEKATTCPPDPSPPDAPLARGKVTFPATAGNSTVHVEVARTRAEAERGLMYRTGLAAEEGMLFVWDEERIRTFWMKNTCIPLDMLFIAMDGTVVGVLEEVPVLNEELLSIPCAASFVLEVNAGFARDHGVTPGMKAAIHL